MFPSNQVNIRYVTLWIPLTLGVKVLHLVYVTWAWVVCLICTPLAFGPAALGLRGVHIRHTTCAHVTYTKWLPIGPVTGSVQENYRFDNDVKLNLAVGCNM